MKRTILIVLGLLLPSLAFAQARGPERSVDGNRVISKADPAATVVVPATATYIGAERWDLYDIADCELHLYVEADEHKRVQRLYWIQFEAYLPSNSHTYDYSGDAPVTFSGLPFRQRISFGPTSRPQREGSDGQRVRQMLTKAGYHLPAESMNVRLVHLLDDAGRKELMFIYGEDLALAGGDTSTDAQEAFAARAKTRIRLER